jgi:hypothetical protein
MDKQQNAKNFFKEKRHPLPEVFHLTQKTIFLILFYLNKNGSNQIKNWVILHEAESLCVNFANKRMNAKQCLIKRFMKKVKLELRAPKRKVHQAVLVQVKKVQPCQGVECTLPCSQKANCPAQKKSMDVIKK